MTSGWPSVSWLHLLWRNEWCGGPRGEDGCCRPACHSDPHGSFPMGRLEKRAGKGQLLSQEVRQLQAEAFCGRPGLRAPENSMPATRWAGYKAAP